MFYLLFLLFFAPGFGRQPPFAVSDTLSRHSLQKGIKPLYLIASTITPNFGGSRLDHSSEKKHEINQNVQNRMGAGSLWLVPERIETATRRVKKHKLYSPLVDATNFSNGHFIGI